VTKTYLRREHAWGNKNYKIVVGKSQGKRPLERPGHR
jgi:hypothetical protein